MVMVLIEDISHVLHRSSQFLGFSCSHIPVTYEQYQKKKSISSLTAFSRFSINVLLTSQFSYASIYYYHYYYYCVYIKN